jgi:hypothetical protein
MRAAAEMKKQAATQGGGGKGMMSIVLPMYAVGIVLYLIYTMTKVCYTLYKTTSSVWSKCIQTPVHNYCIPIQMYIYTGVRWFNFVK